MQRVPFTMIFFCQKKKLENAKLAETFPRLYFAAEQRTPNLKWYHHETPSGLSGRFINGHREQLDSQLDDDFH